MPTPDWVKRRDEQRKQQRTCNLFDETIETIKFHKADPADVEWVGSTGFGFITWDEFVELAKFTMYDPGFGAAEVATDLMVVAKDWWLTRHEYDGSEHWDFHTAPAKPDQHIFGLKRLMINTDHQIGWRSLADCQLEENEDN